MKLLLIRHAPAEDPRVFAKTGLEDDLRPLTKQGRRKMRRAARGLRKQVPELQVLASSPLRRAVQTAKIISKAYDGLATVELPQLSPRKPFASLVQWLQTQPADATVALVGHEPHLSAFASWMATGLQESFVVLKKGGACLLDVPDEIRAARAKLLWLLKPSQLRGASRASGR